MLTCHFSKIAVLQSLPKEDKKTGKELFENIETTEIFCQSGVEIKYYELKSKTEFLTCLENLAQEALHGKWPILHIECHGSEDQTGIVLGDIHFLAGWSLSHI